MILRLLFLALTPFPICNLWAQDGYDFSYGFDAKALRIKVADSFNSADEFSEVEYVEKGLKEVGIDIKENEDATLNLIRAWQSWDELFIRGALERIKRPGDGGWQKAKNDEIDWK